MKPIKPEQMKSVKELSELYFSFLQNAAVRKSPESLYAPVNYIVSIGGKRIRPLLLLMAAGLYEDDVTGKLHLAHAVEVFHNFTLVHDDIMDEAPLRRGKETVHVKYDLATAILSGDVMMLKTYELILKYFNEPWCLDAVAYFNRIGIQICEGQQWDMDFEQREEVSYEEYSLMIKCKTAVLLGACMKLGAMSAGADRRDQELLEKFAENLGMAFQIQDDILDAFGEGNMVGKEIGGDIDRGKKTFLYICALEQLEDKGNDFKRDYLSSALSREEKFKKVYRYFEKAGVKEKARSLQHAYYDSAMINLDQVSVGEARKSVLRAFAASLFERKM